MRFPVEVQQALKCYVYALIDPRTKEVFYIGKGTGERVFQHAKGDLDSSNPSDKMELISEIKKAGHVVEQIVIRHGLTDEQAFDIESTLIDFCRYSERAHLKNAIFGQGTDAVGVMSTDEIIRRYSAPVVTEIGENCVLININKSYDRASGTDVIYEATRRAWVIGAARRKSTKYALAEYRGFIVGVFAIDHWKVDSLKQDTGKPDRYAFDGKPAPPEITSKYLHKRLSRPNGSQNPIRFSIAGKTK